MEGSNYTLTLMRPRRYADLLAFVREACTHASTNEREISALPFYVKQHVVGWLRPSFAAELRRWPHVFEVHPSYVTMRASPDTTQGRTAAMAEVTRDLEREGVIRGWRDETVSVAPHYASPELLRIERAATRHFGLMAYGAHLNGFTRIGGLSHVWIARRSPSKSIDPGRLDNLVGGRIAAGMSVDETLRKEAWEEAGVAPALLGDLNCVDAVRVEYSVPEGLHREILFVHDLWLPPDFTPVNQDGEVSEIRRMPVEDVLDNLLVGEFTLDAGAVMIDGLLRLGAVPPEDAQYLDLVRLLKP
jgi:8-oxo-dGTP pyrophosphatase MutT (NUDIX family)